MRIFIIVFSIFLISCSPAITQKEKIYPENELSSQISQPDTGCPRFSDTLLSNAIFLVWHHYDPRAITIGADNPKVRHISAKQNDCIMNIFLTVNYTTSNGETKEIGEHLIAQLHNIAPDSFSGKFAGVGMGLFSRIEIKKGLFTYVVSAYTPDNVLKAHGVKEADSTFIEWL